MSNVEPADVFENVEISYVLEAKGETAIFWVPCSRPDPAGYGLGPSVAAIWGADELPAALAYRDKLRAEFGAYSSYRLVRKMTLTEVMPEG